MIDISLLREGKHYSKMIAVIKELEKVKYNLKNWDFSGCSFSPSTEANHYGALFNDADFSGANLSNTYFKWADLRGANFSNANLCGAQFCNVDLRGANLYGADLSGAYFNNVNIGWAKCCNANFSGVQFICVDFRFSDFSDACLNSALLSLKNDNESKDCYREHHIPVNLFSLEQLRTMIYCEMVEKLIMLNK